MVRVLPLHNNSVYFSTSGKPLRYLLLDSNCTSTFKNSFVKLLQTLSYQTTNIKPADLVDMLLAKPGRVAEIQGM